MSMQQLEREILRELREVVKNSSVKQKDVMEWGTSDAGMRERMLSEETIVFLPALQVWVAIPRVLDKRDKE